MRYFLFVIGLFVLFGCRYNRGKNGFVKKEYYSNGNLFSEVEYLNDSIKNGVAKFFYKNGQLKEQGTFTDNIKDGEYVAFFENGTIKERGNFRMGKPLGNFFYYYPNGNLRLYNAQDYKEDVFYALKLDTICQKIKEDGRIISPTVSSPSYKKHYVVDDTLILEYCVAQPPGYKTNILIGHYLKKGKVKKMIRAFEKYPIVQSIATYRFKAKEPGVHVIVNAGELIDSLSKQSKFDTTYTTIEVGM
jgi:hypothetical protein